MSVNQGGMGMGMRMTPHGYQYSYGWNPSPPGTVDPRACCEEIKDILTCSNCSRECWSDICCNNAFVTHCQCRDSNNCGSTLVRGGLRLILGIGTIITPTLISVAQGKYHNPPYISTAMTVSYSICLGLSLIHSIYSVKSNCCKPTPEIRWMKTCRNLDPALTLISLAITTIAFVYYLSGGINQS